MCQHKMSKWENHYMFYNLERVYIFCIKNNIWKIHQDIGLGNRYNLTWVSKILNYMMCTYHMTNSYSIELGINNICCQWDLENTCYHILSRICWLKIEKVYNHQQEKSSYNKFGIKICWWTSMFYMVNHTILSNRSLW